MKRIIPTIIFLVALTIVGIGIYKPWIGDVTETWQIENQAFRLRVDQREDRCFFLCGAYYVFQSAPVGSDKWREIITVHHDDPNPIPLENIRFVNAQVGFVFFHSEYAVTTDAGQRWKVWDAREAKKDIPFESYGLCPSIVEVNVESNGYGRMRLFPKTDGHINHPELQTADYGKTWSIASNQH